MKIKVFKINDTNYVYATSNMIGYMNGDNGCGYYHETASTEIDAVTKVIRKMMDNGDIEPANEMMRRFKKRYQNLSRQITIVDIDDTTITFDDDSYIEWSHYQDCCEHTYADFSQIEDCVGMKFRTPIEFQDADGYGFRFGNGINMVFVPCYSEQNGYYSYSVDVEFYDAETEICTTDSFEGEHIYRP